MDFIFYTVSANIDFYNKDELLGNYNKQDKILSEFKSINRYKDAIWNIQGLINNSISINQDFYIKASVTLYGVTSNNDYVIMRQLELNM